MKPKKLKPCPWPGCDRKPKLAYEDFMGLWIECTTPGSSHAVFGALRKTEAGAIKAWNERQKR